MAGAAGAGSGGVPPVQYEWVESQVAIFPIAEVFADPSAMVTRDIPDETVGSVSLSDLRGSTQSANEYAVLFTTNAADPDGDHATVLNLTPGDDYLTHTTHGLRGSVIAVHVTPDEEFAVALLNPPGGSSAAGYFAVVPVRADAFADHQTMKAAPVGVALLPAPTTLGVVTGRSDPAGAFYSYVVRLPGPGVPVTAIHEVELSSAPLATGIVDEVSVAYVAQEHPEGRITLIQPDPDGSGTLEYEVTGFELNETIRGR